jgi:hypothetical protein
VGIEQHGGSDIDDVERLDDMLLFAFRISRNASDIFEIDLPFHHGSRAFLGLMHRLLVLSNPIIGF